MLATVRLLGIPITCYPAFIIGLCLITKIIRIFLNKYSKKQSEEKAVRDKKIAQLQKEAGGDRDVLSDKIYEYYKESNYNPYLTFLSKVALIVIDFAIVAVMVATFKPISNFHVVEKDTATTITQIYMDKEEKSTPYTEIRVLKDLEKYESDFEKGGVSKADIKKLYDLRDSFSLGSLKTYLVPPVKDNPQLMAVPALAMVLYVAQYIIGLWQSIEKMRLSFKKLKPAGKAMMLTQPILNTAFLALTATIVFNTPIVISFYFIVTYTWNLMNTIVQLIKTKKMAKRTKVDATNNSDKHQSNNRREKFETENHYEKQRAE